jgi:hypothetical protein
MGGNFDNQLHAFANDWTMAMRVEGQHQIDPHPAITGVFASVRINAGSAPEQTGRLVEVPAKGTTRLVVARDHARPLELPVQ